MCIRLETCLLRCCVKDHSKWMFDRRESVSIYAKKVELVSCALFPIVHCFSMHVQALFSLLSMTTLFIVESFCQPCVFQSSKHSDAIQYVTHVFVCILLWTMVVRFMQNNHGYMTLVNMFPCYVHVSWLVANTHRSYGTLPLLGTAFHAQVSFSINEIHTTLNKAILTFEEAVLQGVESTLTITYLYTLHIRCIVVKLDTSMLWSVLIDIERA